MKTDSSCVSREINFPTQQPCSEFIFSQHFLNNSFLVCPKGFIIVKLGFCRWRWHDGQVFHIWTCVVIQVLELSKFRELLDGSELRICAWWLISPQQSPRVFSFASKSYIRQLFHVLSTGSSPPFLTRDLKNCGGKTLILRVRLICEFNITITLYYGWFYSDC